MQLVVLSKQAAHGYIVFFGVGFYLELATESGDVSEQQIYHWYLM